MIGFDMEPVQDRAHINEDPDTCHLDKRELYHMVAHRYLLPPFSSKGVTRDYLLRVHKNLYFRVASLDIRHFEVELTAHMLKRVGIQNNALLMRKINALLACKGQNQLGFDEFDPPDEVNLAHKNWLYRIARYVDQSNLLEFFEAPVVQEPPSSMNTNVISRIYFGRLKASKYFFRLPEAKKDKKLWDSLHSISSMYRGYLSQRMLSEKLQREIDEANRKTAELLRQLDDLISKSGVTYSCIENKTLNPNMILTTDSLNKEVRDQILLNCRLIKYIYCTDTVLDNKDATTLEFTKESIEMLDNNYDVGTPRVSSPQRMDQSRTSTAKATPSKMMEAEKRG